MLKYPPLEQPNSLKEGLVMTSSNLAVIVLSAGKGSRMKTDLPKVLHQIAERPMALHVIHAAKGLNPQKIIAIVGHKAEEVEAQISTDSPEVLYAAQTEQLGTGHAALMAEDSLKDFSGDILILNGDVPLITTELLSSIYDTHTQNNNVLTLTSAIAEDPTGLGRIVRDEHGNILKNVEQKDCSTEEAKIKEANVGIYLVSSDYLISLIKETGNDNAAGEYYITDIIGLAIEKGLKVGSFTVGDPKPYLGVNTPLQLSQNEAIYQQRMREQFMTAGVRMKSPDSVYFAYDTEVAGGTYLGANITFGTNVKISDNAWLEGDSYIRDTSIASNTKIKAFSHIEGAEIEANATVGPFARIRPETLIAENVKVGSFVETKKSTFNQGASVAHLSYVGDTTVGAKANIGGGTITCNYDGTNKHQTTIGADAFIGSNSALVAPVTVGDCATTAAGSTITEDVPAGSLAFGRARQTNKTDNKQRKEA